MSSAKQYNARYGLKPRKKVDAVFELRRNSTRCPYCLKHGVKRLAAGIWYCSSCTAKFTGGAYTFRRKDYRSRVVEADFLKPKETKGTSTEALEGFDVDQEVSF